MFDKCSVFNSKDFLKKQMFSTYKGDISLNINHCYFRYNLMTNILKIFVFFFFELGLCRSFYIVLRLARCNQYLDLSQNINL